MTPIASDALAIWQSAVTAVQPRKLVAEAVRSLQLFGRVIVVGCGKAGAEMAAGVEEALPSTPLPPTPPELTTSPARGEVGVISSSHQAADTKLQITTSPLAGEVGAVSEANPAGGGYVVP